MRKHHVHDARNVSRSTYFHNTCTWHAPFAICRNSPPPISLHTCKMTCAAASTCRIRQLKKLVIKEGRKCSDAILVDLYELNYCDVVDVDAVRSATRAFVHYKNECRSHGMRVACRHSHSSYKRVKGRSHTLEKRISMHPHKLHATSQPSRASHTPRRSTDTAHNQRSHKERHIDTSHHDISTGTAKPASYAMGSHVAKACLFLSRFLNCSKR